MTYLSPSDTVEQVFYLLEYNAYKDAYKDFLKKYEGVRVYNFDTSAELNQLIKSLTDDDKVVLHGFTLKRFWKGFLKLSKREMNKIVWVCWGSGSHWLSGPKGFVINHFRSFLFKRLGAIVALMRPNYDELIQDFKCSNVHLIPYYSSVFDFKNNDWFKGVKAYSHNGGTVRVKVGNSGWPINDHEASFQMLRKFKSEDVKIITPLSYGFEEHIEKIKTLGNDLFGEKFEPLLELIEKKAYRDFLSESVDVMVYNARAQTGLYNLYFGLYAGKKIFAKGYNYDWITSFGAEIHHVDEIKNMTFDQFKEPLSPEVRENNRQKLIEAVDVYAVLPRWKKVLGIN